MYWRKWIADVGEKTSNMNKKEKYSYIATYYWPHILGVVSIIALFLLFGEHYLFGNSKPEFTCVFVNQRVDIERDGKIAETFSKEAKLDIKEVAIDSDYNFSYGDIHLEGVNESAYDKFFFQWQNGELDAVILSEGFYQYCQELGGEFRSIEVEEIGKFEPYMDDGICTAVVLGKDNFTKIVSGSETERLLLAFPKTGKHEENSKKFLRYFCEVYEKKIGGINYEEIIK